MPRAYHSAMHDTCAAEQSRHCAVRDVAAASHSDETRRGELQAVKRAEGTTRCQYLQRSGTSAVLVNIRCRQGTIVGNELSNADPV